MDLKRIPPLTFGGLFFALLHVTTASAPEDVLVVPEQGFFMAARYPETGRAATLHIYALDTDADAGDFVIKKDGGLLSNGIETGDVIKDNEMFGCFLRVFEFNRMRGLRYGRYEGSLMDLDGNSVFDGYTMVKPRTDILDTRGLQTITVYPESDESSDLPERVNIGVAWRPGCRKIKWDKGKRRRVNSGPRMILTSTEDAGLYTIRRRTRAKRGWFVQILVIAATCPENFYYSDEGACVSSGIECSNGGVLRDRSPECICPPFLVGDTCSCAASANGENLYLAVTKKTTLECGDLPGGHKTCKGMEICYGDTFGCKCSPGYWGNACDQECPKGRWGADCNQLCPDSESDCNRFWGPKTNLIDNGCSTEPPESG